MTEKERSRVAAQLALSQLRGKRVIQAHQTIGTSFTIDFGSLRWARRQQLRSGRWTRGHFSSRTYVLFEFCDWRIEFGKRTFRADALPTDSHDNLLREVVGLRLVQARLVGLDGVALQFNGGVVIRVPPSDQGDSGWWIGHPVGTTDHFGIIERT